MYLRFVQVFMDKQVDGMSKHNAIYVIPSHTKKVFSNMKRVGKDFFGKETASFPTILVPAQEGELGEGSAMSSAPQHTPIIQPSTSKPQKKQKPKKSKQKDTQETQPSDPTYEALNEDNVHAQVLNLETTKTAKAKEILSFNRRVKRLEKKSKLRIHGIKRLYKVSLSARVESSAEEQSLDEEDASKQGRNIDDIDAYAKTILVNETVKDQGRINDEEMFDTNVLNDEEVVIKDNNDASIATAVTAATTIVVSIDDINLSQELMEIKTSKTKARGDLLIEETLILTTIDVLNDEEVIVKDINPASITAVVTAATITVVSIDDITLAQALVEIKTLKPKVRGIIIQEPSKTPTTTTIPISSKVHDKGKGIMVEEPLKMKKKDQIGFDEQEARRLQAEIDEQDMLAKEKAQLIEDENLA
uniref:Uncharacterized protein n=1 Tax=Tanacetum cinerariifolium TaxID=118510 RepID=A0A6L2K421_TANCI|nr:hypothetical protein [Tanacetum cinerariifolium]